MVPLPHRPVHLEFYLPTGTNSFMRDLARGLTDLSTSLPLVASCTVVGVRGLGPDAMAHALEGVAARTSGVGIVAGDHPRTQAAIRNLTEAGIRVITIASDLPETTRAAYVGVDNLAAGRTAGLMVGLMLGMRPRTVARERGFRSVMRERFPELRVLPAVEVGEDSARSLLAMQRLLGGPELPGAVYCVGAGRTGVAEAIRSVGGERPLVVMHDLTDSTRAWLLQDLVDVVIDQNARLVAEQSVIRLLGSIATSAPFLLAKHIEPRIILRENLPV
jgi:LacI family transcriptional regulator